MYSGFVAISLADCCSQRVQSRSLLSFQHMELLAQQVSLFLDLYHFKLQPEERFIFPLKSY